MRAVLAVCFVALYFAGWFAIIAAKYAILSVSSQLTWRYLDIAWYWEIVLSLAAGVFFYFLFSWIIKKVYGASYLTHVDSQSDEKYISHYEGRVESGLFSNRVNLKPQMTSDRDQAFNLVMIVMVFDGFAFYSGFIEDKLVHFLRLGY
ncbi:MAG: hypothetical protein CFE33_08710 [Pseudorhodobacter sp. PARRP1]|nr:MAG: hypothetical protein CFE33_08710 [Pseudorhodobacter sp. PARRP1]